VFGSAIRIRKPSSEAERPFWISYADLMTAMMMLFLVAMTVTIVAFTQKEVVKLSEADEQRKDIAKLCSDLTESLAGQGSIHVDCDTQRITFPDTEVGYFPKLEYKLPQKAHAVLAQLVPKILGAADSPLGRKWFKRVLVEGYASRTGTYLFNLNLSMQRSYWVLCLLADPSKNSELMLNDAQLLQVRELFRVGGASFNKPRESEEASRRVEFQLEFNDHPYAKGDPRDSLSGVGSDGPDKCGLL
jgi:outer membrane protein OmpA-like peptidoglycan-associated protein